MEIQECRSKCRIMKIYTHALDTENKLENHAKYSEVEQIKDVRPDVKFMDRMSNRIYTRTFDREPSFLPKRFVRFVTKYHRKRKLFG